MDFGSVALLVGTVFVMTKFLKTLVPDLDSRLTQLAVLLIGIGATFLVAHSDWGAKQVIDGIALNSMNGSSLVLVGIALGCGATVLDQGVKAVMNVGQNQDA